MTRTLALSVVFVAWITLPTLGSEELTFEQDVRPIFRAHCFDCHGANEKLEGKLDLRLVRFLTAGGDSGAAIVPGNPAESYLLERVRNGEMPPGDHRVPDEQVAILEQWIEAGARTARPEPASIGPGLGVTKEERAYWAFRPIHRPAVPSVENAARVRTPIDAFLLRRLEEKGLDFADDADRASQVRRAYLSLLGLPPTPSQVQSFLQDEREDAWEQLLVELMDSPHYGERWGRHWLDVAGYADSEGYTNRDDVRPWAYKYRDWVIRALNQDMPIDQFIQWQLAGDEMVDRPYKNLNPTQIDQLTATGFLRMGADGTSAEDNETSRNQVLTDTIKIVSSSLLGVTVGCAQCHDHRYDPISQLDYYRMRAIFEPAYDYKGWLSPSSRRVSLYTDEDIAKAQEIEKEAQAKQAERQAKQNEFMEAALVAALEGHDESKRADLRKAYETPGGKRTAAQQKLLKDHPNIASLNPGVLYQYNQGHADLLKKMDQEIGAIRAKKPKEEFLRVLTEPEGKTRPVTHLFYRGDHRQPQQPVAPGGLTVAAPPESPLRISEEDRSRGSSGRRLAYARWLTSGRHPLVARVLVNRFWLMHFGQTFVSTPDEFGKLGTPPTHPELLDWLADEFMRKGWSLKELHLLIMTSTAYRQNSERHADGNEHDGANQLYWHFPVQRVDAETIRDSVLAVSGRLLPAQRFGPAVGVAVDDAGQVGVAGEKQRRSVYLQVRRTQPVALLKAFDAPVMEVNCARRPVSTVATQSLMLMNSKFILESARYFAERIQRESRGRVDSSLLAGLEVPQQEREPSPWHWGYGRIQFGEGEKIGKVEFTPYPFFGNGQWKGEEKVPNPTLGFSYLSAAGGHPQDAEREPIRRWVAPISGTISVAGMVQHGSDNGDGVRLLLHSNRLGRLGEWDVKHGAKEYSVTLEVKQGDLIDTVVDSRSSNTSDSFVNRFRIRLENTDPENATEWNSETGFEGPETLVTTIPEQLAFAWQLAYGRLPVREEVELSLSYVLEQHELLTQAGNPEPWKQALTNYCQSLLSSNEFLYMD